MAIENINGTDLYYLTIGRGIPCLVMHGGLGLDHTCFHPWLDPLGDALQLVYYDHRGNGRSGRPPAETMTLDQFAADADALSDHLGFKKVAALGHSVGGFIAMKFALLHPERVSHLILVDTTPAFNYVDDAIVRARRRGATDKMLAALQAPASSDDDELKALFRLILPLYFHKYDASEAERFTKDVIVSAFAGARNEVLMPDYDVTSQLSEIRAATLILVGRDDFICPPSQAEIIHRGIANSKLVVFERSGHYPHVEEPEAFIETVRSWFARQT